MVRAPPFGRPCPPPTRVCPTPHTVCPTPYAVPKLKFSGTHCYCFRKLKENCGYLAGLADEAGLFKGTLGSVSNTTQLILPDTDDDVRNTADGVLDTFDGVSDTDDGVFDTFPSSVRSVDTYPESYITKYTSI